MLEFNASNQSDAIEMLVCEAKDPLEDRNPPCNETSIPVLCTGLCQPVWAMSASVLPALVDKSFAPFIWWIDGSLQGWDYSHLVGHYEVEDGEVAVAAAQNGPFGIEGCYFVELGAGAWVRTQVSFALGTFSVANRTDADLSSNLTSTAQYARHSLSFLAAAAGDGELTVTLDGEALEHETSGGVVLLDTTLKRFVLHFFSTSGSHLLQFENTGLVVAHLDSVEFLDEELL